MRKLFITLCVCLISLGLQAQVINFPKSNQPSDIYLSDTTITLGTIPANTGQIDSFHYATYTFPAFVKDNGFVTMEQVDNLWNGRPYKNEKEVNGIIYKPQNRKQFASLYNRDGIAMFYTIKKYRREYRELTNSERYWWAMDKYHINGNYTRRQFQDHAQIDSLAKGLVYITPIDTTQ